MEYFKYLRGLIENKLNAHLSDEEKLLRPFCIYEDVGDFDFSSRNINDITGKKYGVLSLIGSNISPLTTLKFADITAQCEIIVNVDEMSADEDDPSIFRYEPVAAARKAIEDLISEMNGVAIYDQEYAITPTFTFSSAGTFTVATSNLGKIVPLRFTVNCIFVQNGVSSDSVSYTVTYNDVQYPLYTIDTSESMVATTEGQTHSGEPKVKNTVQEAKYGVELSTPLTSSDFCKHLLAILHDGADNTIYPLEVAYDVGEPEPIKYEHYVIISTVSLSAKKPLNVGLNIAFLEADNYLK